MGSLLTEIVTELKTIPGSEHLLVPVNAKKVKDYYEIVKDPMDLQQIKKHLEDTRPEFERAMQMGHEVLAIRARDATIRKSGGEPPLFRATQVMRAVNQQLYDHQVTGRPITQPAFMEYEHHPCMR